MQFVQNLLFQRGSDRTPSNFPTSFFNEPRRREEHEERREERAIAPPQLLQKRTACSSASLSQQFMILWDMDKFSISNDNILMNNQQSITEISPTTPSYNLLLEIAQIPEEYIPEFLQIVRLFRENVIKKPTSIDDKNIEIAKNHQFNSPRFANI